MEFGNENPPSRLTLECYDKKVTVEWPGSDISATDVIDALFGIMIAQTWDPTVVINSMKEFVDEKYTEE